MSSRGHGPKYTPGKEFEEMKNELAMMYSLYENLCRSYKKLSQEKGIAPAGSIENPDKQFGDWEKEKDKQIQMGERYGN